MTTSGKHPSTHNLLTRITLGAAIAILAGYLALAAAVLKRDR